MKHMKKLAALALAIMMLMGLAIPAAAAEGDTPTTYSVTINNASGHTYKIYQIFKGDVSKNTEGKDVLSNAKYGADYPDSAKVGQDVPLAELQAFTRDTIKESHLRADSGTAMTTDGDIATINGLAAGYYMVVDVTTNLPENESKSAIIFQVVENTTVNSKHTGTTIVKKVQDINDSTGRRIRLD